MAKLPSLKKILREDIKEAPAWIDKLIYVLNKFMEEVYGALNKNITFTENIASDIRSISFLTKSTYPIFDIQKIANPLSTIPMGVILLKAQNVSDNQSIKSPLGIDWDFNEGNVRILHISGLEASMKYKLSFLIL